MGSLCYVPGVVGAIDFTQVKIQSPGGDDAELFHYKKGSFSLHNVQAICNSKLKFINIVARLRGFVHDTHIFENSSIGINLENGTQKVLLLGLRVRMDTQARNTSSLRFVIHHHVWSNCITELI